MGRDREKKEGGREKQTISDRAEPSSESLMISSDKWKALWRPLAIDWTIDLRSGNLQVPSVQEYAKEEQCVPTIQYALIERTYK